jgi:hypothetical protein
LAKKGGRHGKDVWPRKEEDKEKTFCKERRKIRRRSLAKYKEDKYNKFGKERKKTRRSGLSKKGEKQG